MNDDPPPPRLAAIRRWRSVVLLALVVVLGALSGLFGPRLVEALEPLLALRRLAQEQIMMHPLLLLTLVLYAVLIAIPFVPGAELGILLLVLFGAPIAVPVYAATVSGLTLAFVVGCCVPHPWFDRALARLGLERALEAVEHVDRHGGEPAPPPASQSKRRFGRLMGWALRYRWLGLALLINTPGNTLIGGGGGIAMAAGISGLFTLRGFLASVVFAVAPVPATILLISWLT